MRRLLGATPALNRARVAALLLTYGLLSLAVLAGLPVAAFITGALVLVAEFWSRYGDAELKKLLPRMGLSVKTRGVIRSLLVVLLLLRLAPDALPAAPFVIAAVVMLLTSFAQAELYRTIADTGRNQIVWRGLKAHGLANSHRLRPSKASVVFWILADVPILLGAPLAAAFSAWAVVVGFGILAVVLAAASWVEFRRQTKRMAALGSREDTLALAQRALDAYAPTVILYFSARTTGTYEVNVWLETAARFTEPTLIMLREAHHLANLEGTKIPIVVAPSAGDVEALTVESVRTVLHPANGIKQHQIMRLPGLLHCFIGHGDSDKSASYNPVTKVYDEIWVAGPAGRDRYLPLHEGFEKSVFTEVGRPQLAEIETLESAGPRAAGQRGTVLYAPTWEGILEQDNYSSLPTMGVPMIEALLALPEPPRIIFKPHPSSGHRSAGVIAARDRIVELIAADPENLYLPAGGAGTLSLYDAFNRADVMITDISSVVTDFLASHKPYIVANPQDVPLEEFLARFPSTSGGVIVSPGLEGFVGAAETALAGDPEGRARRIAVSRYLLGDSAGDPVERFAREVSASVERAKAKYPALREVVSLYAEGHAGAGHHADDSGADEGAEPDEGAERDQMEAAT